MFILETLKTDEAPDMRDDNRVLSNSDLVCSPPKPAAKAACIVLLEKHGTKGQASSVFYTLGMPLRSERGSTMQLHTAYDKHKAWGTSAVFGPLFPR